jgi:PBP1b-binding outer membrane lipoprotein LpoB
MKTLVFASLLLVGCHAVSAPYVEFKSKAYPVTQSNVDNSLLVFAFIFIGCALIFNARREK